MRQPSLNLVFDLGGVVLRWDPDAIVASVYDDPEVRKVVREGIFSHRDWLDLDKGVLDQPTAIVRGALRTGRPEAEIRRLMDQVPASLVPNPRMLDLLQTVKKAGHRLLALSNMPLLSMEYLEREYSFWDLFDDLVISYRIHMIKPDREIFEHLLREYALEPANTIFFDDVDVNLKPAADLGIRAVKFISAEQCEGYLKDSGII